MWVSKISELIGITGIEIVDKRIKVEAGRIIEYRVRLRLSFDMAPETDLHW